MSGSELLRGIKHKIYDPHSLTYFENRLLKERDFGIAHELFQQTEQVDRTLESIAS